MRCSRGLFAIVMVFGCLVAPGPAQAQTPEADRIFHNGVILTMSEDLPVAEAVAISDGLVLAVGSSQEILGLAGDNTRIVDLAGRSIIPGFVDAHSHIFSEAADRGMTIQQVHGIALSNGITTVGNVVTLPDVLEEMMQFEAEGRLRIRTSLYLALTDFCGTYLGNWFNDYPPTENREARLRIAGLKLFVDGGICGDIATSFEYVSGHGNLWRTQSGLNQLTSTYDLAGYQLAMHAQGDLAIEQALNAIQHLSPDGLNPRRHRIEHNSFVRNDLRERYDETGAVAILFGRFPTCAEVRFGALSNRYGDDDVTWLEDWRALLDANENLRAGWHSDYPYFVLDPIQHLASYVTRAEVGGDGTVCQPPAWLKGHAISPTEALGLMTRGAAYALDRDDQVGTLEVGKKADLVILSQDPTSVAPEAIIDTEILSTFIDGSLMFCRPGSERVCGLPVSTEDEIPVDFETGLKSIHPNPTRGSVEVSFTLAVAGPVEIAVFDVAGRQIAEITNQAKASGAHIARWHNTTQTPGVYLVTLRTANRVVSEKIVVLP